VNTTFRVAHSSGQFSDLPEQQRVDAHRILRRVHNTQALWCTGTEAGSNSVLKPTFLEIDQDHGLRFVKGKTGDVWTLYRLDLFDGKADVEWYKVVDGHGGKGAFADRGILRVTGYSPLFKADGTILCAHLVTHGQPDAVTQSEKRRLGYNEQIMAKAAELGKEFGAGRNLVFYGGDQNVPERKGLLLGAPFTSLATELDKVQNTGHGPIDCIASYNKDGRISGVDFDVLDDHEFRLNTDHFYCEGVFALKEPKRRG